MDAPDRISNDLDLFYTEYVRLNKRLDTIMDGSWNDFKLLGMRDLTRQSVMQHYLFELQLREEDIRTALRNSNVKGFRLASYWMDHGARTWRGIMSRFYLAFCLFLFFFPVGVLTVTSKCLYAIAYGVAAAVGMVLFLNAARLLANPGR